MPQCTYILYNCYITILYNSYITMAVMLYNYGSDAFYNKVKNNAGYECLQPPALLGPVSVLPQVSQ